MTGWWAFGASRFGGNGPAGGPGAYKEDGVVQGSVVRRPPVWEERLSHWLFLALSPRLPCVAQPETPRWLAPFEPVAVERPEGGVLSATWYPATEPARGAVLLLHPWAPWGKAYFHRRSRLRALREAGYHALTLDFSRFGESGPPAGFFDRDVEAGIAFLRQRIGSLPLHVWGVSFGGYWAHPALARSREVSGAVFEDVSPHLLQWSWRMAPLGRPGYLFFRHVFRRAYGFLDARRHAAALRLSAVTYISGEKDPGILPEETRELAALARGKHRIIPAAGHLSAIKLATDEVHALAVQTFREAEETPRDREPPPEPFSCRDEDGACCPYGSDPLPEV